MASYVSNSEGQLPGRLQRVQVTDYPLPMVVANVEPLLRFNLVSNVVSARSIRMILNSESLTNISRIVNSLSRLIVSNARLMSIPSTRNDF